MTWKNPKGLILFKIILTILMIVLLVKCKSNKVKYEEKNIPFQQTTFNKLYLNKVDEFRKSLVDLKKAVTEEQDDSIQILFTQSFMLFKQFGFVLEYYDHELYNLYNGAPVKSEDASSPGVNTVEPMGLQVVYELIKEPMINHNELIFQIDFLDIQLQYVTVIADYEIIEEQTIINAIDELLIRFETLSLSGFDNPDLMNEYEYLTNELNTINEYLSYCSTGSNQLKVIVDSTIVTNKLDFIKTKIQPFRLQLNEYVQNEKKNTSVDYSKSNIYDSKFINASYFSSNGIVENESKAKRELGRALFNDPIISNSSVNFSCATCHQVDKYFTDGLATSKSSFSEISLDRNTPTLIHAGYQSKFMYDGRANSLEEQMLHVFKNNKELDISMTVLIEKIKSEHNYFNQFETCYPSMASNPVNMYTITDVLATYVRSLTAHQTIFDKYMRGELIELDSNVAAGFNLFMGKAKCGTCHFVPTFSGLIPPLYQESELENIGVPGSINDGVWEIDTDLGRYNFYPNKAFKHFFKTPTLRNVEFTSPYMHNGIFNTLEEVMDFYNLGGGVGHELAYRNQTLPSENLNLSEVEIEQIISFMKSLSDSNY